MAVVKQLKNIAVNVTENDLIKGTKDSAQQIWLAGLGAFAKAQSTGNKVFEELVKEGEALQAKTQKAVSKQVSKGTSKATETWDKLEQVFQDRVAGVVARLGVPSRKEVAELTERVEELTKLLEKAIVAEKKAASVVKKAALEAKEVTAKSTALTAAELEVASQ
ncbi:poly(hydroxyalkanoate) granule-associated protein [Chitinivorax tropicus]|uniref:Poly(Hydroxyalkanoate) granule-associated protein n=1 Tax=Chitinivorax tropicus TaxID=714531 RepID=A0A840MCG3_9PROT|nr:phasin family protein [Chitinivorax tropicus]MBB5017004.1 poly(hydroxyalkanoate) granule-associated protein [Chitinivorax tropicus]